MYRFAYNIHDQGLKVNNIMRFGILICHSAGDRHAIERFAYAVAFEQIVLSAAFIVAPSDLRVAPVLAWIASK